MLKLSCLALMQLRFAFSCMQVAAVKMKKGDFAALCREPPVYLHLSSHLAPATPSGVHPTASCIAPHCFLGSLRFGAASICLAACADEGSAHSSIHHAMRRCCTPCVTPAGGRGSEVLDALKVFTQFVQVGS